MTETENRNVLLEKLREINHREACLKFFALLKELIDIINLPEDDSRLAFATRKDKMISANVNFRSALSIRRQNGIKFGFIFKKVDKYFLKSIENVEVEDMGESSNFITVNVPFSHASILDNTRFLQKWGECLTELVETASISFKKKSHNTFIYQVAENENLRIELFWQLEHPDEGYSPEKLSLVEEKTAVYQPKPNLPAKNLIFYGPPGTGKTYQAKQLAENFEQTFLCFHPSFSYEEFIEGIRPEAVNGQISYQVKKGIFYQVCLNALKKANYTSFAAYWNDHAENRKKRIQEAESVLLIIDEINRANISKVFGELLSLLESNKRMGESEEMTVKLSYSQEIFGIPANLYIIGTMNTVDRSIALLDVALRRRFHFKEIKPDYSLLNYEIEGIHLGKLLKKINERISFLIDPNHTIGHGYLMNCEDFEQLCSIFSDKIIPLLEEYFYNDVSKIQLTLGEELILRQAIFPKDVFGKNTEDYEEKLSYQVNADLYSCTLSSNVFISIYT